MGIEVSPQCGPKLPDKLCCDKFDDAVKKFRSVSFISGANTIHFSIPTARGFVDSNYNIIYDEIFYCHFCGKKLSSVTNPSNRPSRKKK